MSNKKFTNEEINLLSMNKYVLRVNQKGITYSNEFKMHFIAEYSKGKTTRVIFEESGFDIDILGEDRIRSAGNRWRSAYKTNGVTGLEDTRRTKSGRPRKRELTKDDVIAKQNAEIEYLKAEIELLKKLELQERQVKKSKLIAAETFKLIESIILRFNHKNIVSHLCKVSGVSRSGYYRYLKTKDLRLQRDKLDEKVRDNILKAFNYKGYKKGSRTIKMTLEKKYNIIYSRKRIQRIMKKFNIVCPIRRANPYKRIAKATKEHTVVPNLLNRDFKQEVPGKVLLTDITYMPYGNNQMAYLSTIKDGSTNEILAYNVSNKITLDIATDTIHKLMKKRSFTLHKDAFIHSDQGSHYTSPKFQKLLKYYKSGQSMSRRGNCWDNAPQESFFGHMKDEIDYKNCMTLSDLEKVINKYMKYYNNHRYQWNLKKLTPVEYRNQLLAA